MSSVPQTRSERKTIRRAVEWIIVTLVFGVAVWGALNQF